MAKSSNIGKYRNKTGASGFYGRVSDKAARDVLDNGLAPSSKRKKAGRGKGSRKDMC